MTSPKTWIAGISLALALTGWQPAQAEFAPARRVAPPQCEFNDECAQPLVCSARYCRQQCRTDRDCTNGWVCQQQVWSNAGGDGNRNRFLEVYVPHSRMDSQPGVEAAAIGEVRAVCVAPGLINPTTAVQPGRRAPEPKRDPKAGLGPVLQEFYDKEKQAAEAKARQKAEDQKP